MNILHIYPATVAVLSTLIFNAIIIPLLIPVSMRGARFQATDAPTLLRRNMLLYGLGGLVSAFIGIKLIAMLLGVFYV